MRDREGPASADRWGNERPLANGAHFNRSGAATGISGGGNSIFPFRRKECRAGPMYYKPLFFTARPPQ